VYVSRENQAAAIPGIRRVAGYLRIVGDHLPGGEVIENGALVILEDSEIDILMVPCLATKPCVDGLAATKEPASAESRHDICDARDRFRNGVVRSVKDGKRQRLLLGKASLGAWAGAGERDRTTGRVGAHPVSSGGCFV
jgi:hypothetical protein